MASIFKPRNSHRADDSTNASKDDTQVEELTKNKFYCVSRLPGLPQILKTQSFDNAYSDSESNYSLVINDGSIYVWSYKSLDTEPFSIHFPIDKSIFKLPMAILTRPSSGTDQDPGLIMIDSITGYVKYYESVQHAPTLGLINDKSLELQIELQKDEVITLAENVEPAGICISTSFQRCLMISLRDYKSKPNLSIIEMINPNSGLLAKFFKHENNEIVAIRSGRTSENSTSQQILVLDSTGTLYSIHYCLLSASSYPFIDKQKSFKQNLYIDVDTYPSSQQNTQWLDIWSLAEENYFLALCNVNEKLVLVTLGCDKSGSLFYGAHQLNSIEKIPNKPKLFLPEPGKTAFVVADDDIVMTDINTSYIESKHTFSYYRPRWEDVVRLKESTKIIGYGYENQSPISNPSIILITKGFGVIRIEKFPESTTTETIEEINSPLSIVKSHIEQGIFYSDSMEIDFDLSDRFDSSTIEEAIKSIINEVITSQSAYIPKSLPSITEITQFKVKTFKELLNYCKRNFNKPDTLSNIIEQLQKSNVALNIWKFIDSKKDSEYFKIFKSIKPDYKDFFLHDIKTIGGVYSTYINKLDEQGLDTGSLIISTLYDGIYTNSSNFTNSEKSEKSWIFDTNLVIKVEEIFQKDYIKDGSESEETIKFVELLYYFFNLAIRTNQGEIYHKIYVEKKKDWISSLLNINLENNAINIAETYHDFKSLAEILSSQKEITPINELNYVKYFEEFGYEFASAVYENDLQNNNIQELLLNFTNYKPYLLRFFHENPKKTSSIAWIRYLLDDKYAKVSEILQLAQSYNLQTIDNQLTQLSIAKLSSVAANDTVKEINNEILRINYQLNIRNEITNKTRIEAIKDSFFIQHFLNPNIDSTFKKEVTSSYFPTFQKNFKLTDIQLINLLTTIKTKILDNNNFHYVFNLANFEHNEILKESLFDIILVRLLTIAVENFDSNLSDKDLNSKIRNSALFKAIHNQPQIIRRLKHLLINPPKTFDNQLSLSKFDDALLHILHNKLEDSSFVDLINSVIEQAKVLPI
ncbi:NUP133 [Candida pseudojiufengensis]|uniref:NUP133 n=1 Tax=Candida pseudojiufengensis TaxID=497109 RepID=UPI0022257800|nr:NUP133 [Candida pseudojiufengensis]KAI5963271.1 NUP133 [Candida pseudojiufengensis]